MISADLVLQHASAVVTCAGASGPAEARLAVVPDGAVAALAGKIVWVGEARALSGEVRLTDEGVAIDAEGGLIAPGYVDAHTHLVFAGDRADEFGARCAGASYEELLAQGGGILSTVRATRAASEDELRALAMPRLARLLAEGVTSAEVKSGYGLTPEEELKLLRVIRALDAAQPISLTATALPLHALPPEAAADRDAYVKQMLEAFLPQVAEQGLARFVDLFVERAAFTHDEARRLAAAAKRHGLGLRLHVDQLTAGGGAELAAELGAISADHLETVSPEGIAALAQAGVIATLLPISTLYLRQPRYAPGRALVDAGVSLALGTNCNPGSAMTESFALALSLACLGCELTPAEAFLAATAGGAELLGLSAGRLVPGAPADLVVHGAPSVAHLAYHLGTRHARWVLKHGRVVHEARALPAVCR